jgi:hypothetical protein
MKNFQSLRKIGQSQKGSNINKDVNDKKGSGFRVQGSEVKNNKRVKRICNAE